MGGPKALCSSDLRIFGTPITQEPDNLEGCGFWHFLAQNRAEIKFFSDFAKSVRGRAEGQKIVFGLPSLTREPFDIGSSTLRCFVAQSIPHSINISHSLYYVSGRAKGPVYS